MTRLDMRQVPVEPVQPPVQSDFKYYGQYCPHHVVIMTHPTIMHFWVYLFIFLKDMLDKGYVSLYIY